MKIVYGKIHGSNEFKNKVNTYIKNGVKGITFKQAKKRFMREDTIEGADLAFEIAPYVLKKINNKKIPLMIALLKAITKNKKLKINY